MEYFEGIKISNSAALDLAGTNRRKIAERFAASICNQILRDGFFHADPHPGNIQVMPDGTIIFLDLGMVGCFNESRKRKISNFLSGLPSKTAEWWSTPFLLWRLRLLEAMSRALKKTLMR